MASLSSPLAPPALPAAQAQPQAGLVNIERNLESQKEQNVKQTQEISGLRTTVESLRTETSTLNNGIGSVSNLIQQDAAAEKQQEQQEVVRESRLVETKVRMGKESQLEQSITNALVAPVQALQSKVTNIFGGIKEALFTLFAGWLTNQGIEALKASAEGNKTKLEQIRDRVLNAFGDVIKIFAVIQKGFGLVIKSVTGLAGRIVGFVTKLALAPIKALTNVVRGAPLLTNIFGGPKKPGGGVRGPGIFGGVGTAIDVGMNLRNEEYVDAAVGAVGLTPTLPGAIARGVSIVDNVAEVFGVRGGAGIIGNNAPGDAQKSGTLSAKSAVPAAKVASTAGSAPASIPQTPMMRDSTKPKESNAPPKIVGPILEPAEKTPLDAAATAAPAATAAATTASSPMTSMAPQAADLSLKPGQLVAGQDPSRAMNNEEFAMSKQARAQGKADGLSGKELEIYVATAVMNVGTPSTANISSPTPKQTPNVGALPEPSPNVIMAGGQGGSQQSPTPQAPSAGSDTPIINSSNPDNFYVLYSQLNYNVVI